MDMDDFLIGGLWDEGFVFEWIQPSEFDEVKDFYSAIFFNQSGNCTGACSEEMRLAFSEWVNSSASNRAKAKWTRQIENIDLSSICLVVGDKAVNDSLIG